MPVETPNAPPPKFGAILDQELQGVVPPGKEQAAPPQPKPTPPTPAQPQPVKPAEPAPEDFEAVAKEIETGKRAPRSEDFRRIKHAADEGWKKAKEYEPKLKDYEKKLAELEKQPKHNAELIKQLETERDRYKGMFEQVAVEISPEFHAKYKTKLESVKATLPADISDRLMSLMQLPDSDVKREQLANITADMSEFQVAEVVAANREVRQILNERQGELNRSQEALSKIGEERNKKQAERQTMLSKTFDEVIGKAQNPKDGIPVFQMKEGDEAWNKGVSERVAMAKAIFEGSLSDSEKAEASLWSVSSPEFLSQLKSTKLELAQALETIAKLQGSTPALDGQGGGAPTDRKLTFAERMEQDMRRAG